jgi:hypothetical protein
MTSFQRQLNLYGFRRVTKGDDVGSYYHPKFQRGRRDLIAEIKRLPGKSTTPYDDKNKSIIGGGEPTHRYIPNDGNIVEFMGANNRPVTMSKLTMKIAGINSTNVSVIAPQNYPTSIPSIRLTPAYVSENAVQFLNLPSAGDSRPLPTVCLSREPVENNPPPLLLRNFSVSSTFDEEYRLPAETDEAMGCPKPLPAVKTIATDPFAKPSLPIREESESWVKLGALDQLHDMDPFDIDTVFE